MKRMVLLGVAAWLVWTAGGPAPVAAQSRAEPRWSVSAAIGLSLPDLGSKLSDYGASVGVGFGRNTEFQAWVASEYRLSRSWGIEIMGRVSLGDLGLELGDNGLTVWWLQINGVYHFAASGTLRPYVTAGLGLAMLESDIGRDRGSMAGNLGGGLDLILFGRENLALRVDARFLFYGFDEQVLGPTSTFNASVSDFGLTAGLRYRF